MNELSKYTPKEWNHKNIEIILETQIIEGRSGPPRIAAVQVWQCLLAQTHILDP